MAQIVYFSHGGGPMPILGDPSHKEMISFMKELPNKIRKPKAIVVISAHWEEKTPTIIESEKPSLFYDYYGFPEEAYKLKYQTPSNVALVSKIVELFAKAESPINVDRSRGLDHGVYIPLLMMYPQADIAVTQISLVSGLDPQAHLKLGEVLSQIDDPDVLIIGSGFSFHNMRAFNWRGTDSVDQENNSFQDWLTNVCTGELSQAEREESLRRWESAPNARYCHPREEHLMPIHVCCSAAKRKGEIIFDNYIIHKRAIAVKW